MNNGQTCNIGTRVLAPRSRYDEVLEVFSDLAGALVVGDSLDPATQVGPLASARQRERVEGYIAKGRAEGGRVVAGGGRPTEQERGWFVQPTIFADVDNSDTIAREEIFGPVLAVIPYEGVEDAVAIANDSEFGLGGSVWTRDAERGRGRRKARADRQHRDQPLHAGPRRPLRWSEGERHRTRARPRGPRRPTCSCSRSMRRRPRRRRGVIKPLTRCGLAAAELDVTRHTARPGPRELDVSGIDPARARANADASRGLLQPSRAGHFNLLTIKSPFLHRRAIVA